MGEYEDRVERLREEGLDEYADFFEGFSGSNLRKKAERTEALEREKKELEARVRTLEQAPQIEEAFRKAGVDYEALRPAERKLLANLEVEDVGALTEEYVSKVIADNELPIVEGTPPGEGEEPNAARVVAAANAAPRGAAASRAQITPEDAAGWSTDKWVRFGEKHPEEKEALKRGETVTGITF